MACPKCGCQVHYQFDNGDVIGTDPLNEELERCAACGYVFALMDEADDDEEW
jgi:hypothetical protein